MLINNSSNAEIAYTVVKINSLPVYSGPCENFSVVGSLSLGDTVWVDTIISSWCHVKSTKQIYGYANGWYLSKSSVEKKQNSSVSTENTEKGFKAGFRIIFKKTFIPLCILWGLFYGIRNRVTDRRYKKGYREMPLSTKQFILCFVLSGIISSILGLINGIISWFS